MDHLEQNVHSSGDHSFQGIIHVLSSASTIPDSKVSETPTTGCNGLDPSGFQYHPVLDHR